MFCVCSSFVVDCCVLFQLFRSFGDCIRLFRILVSIVVGGARLFQIVLESSTLLTFFRLSSCCVNFM